ncbi:hypothetical protein PPERSA_10942 [Pseudocohnilembus persalinus]|uniref:protein S-acyltransferase n=1 Tax=Pseudocohnilembus persalinus TaxID=266149 RepID=A0A0V0QCH4_PSEPJ|nr:hypothetical protein PPERSA_10942 [Pseudocohnilembus persalinus]|eukprot:KRW99823.1 hypothetical protein PPERSA_10942 [Pseudocohnilembus persalinus]
MFGQMQSESLVPRQFKFSKNINREEQNQYLDKFIEIVDEREDSLIEEFQNYRYIYGLEKLKERQVTNEKLQKQIKQNNQKMKQRELIQGWKGKSKVSIKRFSSLKSKLNVNKSENQKLVQFLQQEESQKEKNQNEKFNEIDNQENQRKKINSLPVLNQKTRSSTTIKNFENKQNQKIQQNLRLKNKKSVQTEEEKKQVKQDNYEEKKDKNFQLYEKLNNLLKNLKNRNEERLKKILKGNRSQLNDKGILEAEIQIAKQERKNYVAQFIKTIKGIYDKNRDHNFSADENQHNSQIQSQQFQQQSGGIRFESGEKSVQERKIKNFNYFEIFLKTLDDMEKSLEARKDLEGYLEQIDQKKDFSSIQEISKMQNDIFIEYRDNREKLKDFVYEIVKEFEDFQHNNQKFYEDLDKQLNRKKIKQQKLKDLKKLFARKIEESRKLEEFRKFCKNQEIQKDQLNKSINEKQMDYFQTDWINFENDRFYHYLAQYNEGESYLDDDKHKSQMLDQLTNDLFNSANTNQKQQTSKLKSEGKNSSNRSLNEARQNQKFKTSQNQIENGNFTKRNSRVQFIENSKSKDYLQESGQKQYQQLNKNQQQNQEQMDESQNYVQQQKIKKYNYMGNMRNKQKSKSIDMGQYENQQKQLDILKEQLEIYLKEQKQQEIFEKMKLQDSIKNNNQSQSQKIRKRLDFNLKNTVVSFYKHSSEKMKRAQNKNKEQNITDFGSHNFLKSTIKSRERKKFNQDEVFQMVQSNKGNIDRVQFLQKINEIKNNCEVLTENEIFKPAKRINNLYKNAYYQQNQNEFKQKAQVFKRGTDLDLKQDQYQQGVEQMVKINKKMDKNSDSNEQSEIYETPSNKLNGIKKRNYTISFSDKKMDQLYNGQKMIEKQLDLDQIRLGTCISLDKIDNKAQKMLKSSSNYSVFKESINQYRSHALWLQEYYKLNQNLKDKYGDRLETYQQDQMQKQIKTEKNTQMLNYLQKVLVPISEDKQLKDQDELDGKENNYTKRNQGDLQQDNDYGIALKKENFLYEQSKSNSYRENLSRENRSDINEDQVYKHGKQQIYDDEKNKQIPNSKNQKYEISELDEKQINQKQNDKQKQLKKKKQQQSQAEIEEIYENDYKLIKLYKFWMGSNKFLCGGYLITGSRPLMNIFSLLLALLPMNKNNDPELDLIPNSGIEGNEYLYQLSNKGIGSLKYCQTCDIYRPVGTSHCSHCDNCVEMFDHHCQYLNNCIGKRNYSYYFFSLIFGVLFIVMFEFSFIDYLIDESEIWEKVYLGILISMALVVYCLVMILLSYHVFLSLNQLRTVEHLKNEKKDISEWSQYFQIRNSMYYLLQRILAFKQRSSFLKNSEFFKEYIPGKYRKVERKRINQVHQQVMVSGKNSYRIQSQKNLQNFEVENYNTDNLNNNNLQDKVNEDSSQDQFFNYKENEEKMSDLDGNQKISDKNKNYQQKQGQIIDSELIEKQQQIQKQQEQQQENLIKEKENEIIIKKDQIQKNYQESKKLDLTQNGEKSQSLETESNVEEKKLKMQIKEENSQLQKQIQQQQIKSQGKLVGTFQQQNLINQVNNSEENQEKLVQLKQNFLNSQQNFNIKVEEVSKEKLLGDEKEELNMKQNLILNKDRKKSSDSEIQTEKFDKIKYNQD